MKRVYSLIIFSFSGEKRRWVISVRSFSVISLGKHDQTELWRRHCPESGGLMVVPGNFYPRPGFSCRCRYLYVCLLAFVTTQLLIFGAIFHRKCSYISWLWRGCAVRKSQCPLISPHLSTFHNFFSFFFFFVEES